VRIRAAHDSVRSLLPQVLSVANLDNGLGARGISGVADRYFTPVSRRSRRISRLTPTYQGAFAKIARVSIRLLRNLLDVTVCVIPISRDACHIE